MFNDLELLFIFVGILIALGRIIDKTFEAICAAAGVGIISYAFDWLGFPLFADLLRYLLISIPSKIFEIF